VAPPLRILSDYFEKKSDSLSWAVLSPTLVWVMHSVLFYEAAADISVLRFLLFALFGFDVIGLSTGFIEVSNSLVLETAWGEVFSSLVNDFNLVVKFPFFYCNYCRLVYVDNAVYLGSIWEMMVGVGLFILAKVCWSYAIYLVNWSLILNPECLSSWEPSRMSSTAFTWVFATLM
jgi:hypothetical protein